MGNKNNMEIKQITNMETDFAQWFTDVCKKAETSSDNSINAVCKSGDLKVNFQNKH